jgi:hypothetical protein
MGGIFLGLHGITMHKTSRLPTEILAAQNLFQAIINGPGLDSHSIEALERYRQEIAKHRRLMAQSGVSEACRRCYEADGCTCCFAGAEEWYDRRQILMNLLFDVELPQARKILDGCWFLGAQGCKLAARCGVCVNYLCGSAARRLGAAARDALRLQAGKELLAGIDAENAVMAQILSPISKPADTWPHSLRRSRRPDQSCLRPRSG